jgi:hypothetical protein
MKLIKKGIEKDRSVKNYQLVYMFNNFILLIIANY